MMRSTGHLKLQDRLIARLLWAGTWTASAMIASGLIFNFLQRSGIHGTSSKGDLIIKAGVAFFILLPVARVALMLILFIRDRDRVYALISAAVLATIAAGVVFGIRS